MRFSKDLKDAIQKFISDIIVQLEVASVDEIIDILKTNPDIAELVASRIREARKGSRKYMKMENGELIPNPFYDGDIPF